MKLSDLAADLMVTLYGWNRRTMKFRGGYRALIMASNLLPRLRAYPIHFRETGTIEVDVKFPDTYWLLNEYVGDPHKSLVFLRRVAEAVVKPRDVIWDVGANMGFIS